MNVRTLLIPAAFALGSMLAASDMSLAAEGVRGTLGIDTVSLDQRAPARRFPVLMASAQIPSTIDTDKTNVTEHSCSIHILRVSRSGEITGVKNVKGRYSTTLYVLDPMSGTFQDARIASGKLKTSADGRASFLAPVPTELLADSFESGNTTAWTATTITLTSTRKINLAQGSCSIADVEVLVTAATD